MELKPTTAREMQVELRAVHVDQKLIRARRRDKLRCIPRELDLEWGARVL